MNVKSFLFTGIRFALCLTQKRNDSLWSSCLCVYANIRYIVMLSDIQTIVSERMDEFIFSPSDQWWVVQVPQVKSRKILKSYLLQLVTTNYYSRVLLICR